MLSRNLTSLLSLTYPIIQAPMAGGITTPALISAVSNAGALGSLAGGLLSPLVLKETICNIRRATQAPFSVNLFLYSLSPLDMQHVEKMSALLAPLREELGLAVASIPSKWCEDISAQFEVLLETRPPVASFTFGLLTQEQLQALKSRHIVTIGTATTVEEAIAWQDLGADCVCMQGAEAGGHRGTFLKDVSASLVGTMALVPQAVNVLHIPVIAAGGIMDGRGIAAAMSLGAQAVQLGTAFLPCEESGTHPVWKERLLRLKEGEDPTVLTRAFSGKTARGLRNGFTEHFEECIPLPYPYQQALTAEIRSHAARHHLAEYMALWAGQGAAMCRALPAAQLIKELVTETQEAVSLRGPF